MAKMAATLDTISDGRLILGMGAGWHEPEYTSFGYPFDHLVGRFEEDIEVIDRLLRGETVDFDGRWSRYAGAQLLPPPARKTPVLIASKGERMLRLTARWADAWNTAWYGRIDDTLRERTAGIDAALDAAGRDRASLRRTVGIRLHEPGARGDDARGTDADADGLADLFDELEAFGFHDALVWSIGKTTAAIERLARAREIHLARRVVGSTAPVGARRDPAAAAPGPRRVPSASREDPGSRREVAPRSPRACPSRRGRSPARRPRPGPRRSGSSRARRAARS